MVNYWYYERVRREDETVSITHQITEGTVQDGVVRFVYNGAMEDLGETPSGKMITDSDEETFVYLFEEGEAYQTIHFTQAVWPLMQQLVEEEMNDPILDCTDGEVILQGFTEELNMLIFNIEGNSNYGENFMIAVEQAFERTLKAIS